MISTLRVRLGILASLPGLVGACSDASTRPLEQEQQPAQPTQPAPPTPPVQTARLEGTLAFVSKREGTAHIYLSNADGSDVRRLTNSTDAEYTPAWSPDGQRLAFNRDDGTFVIRKDGSGLVRLPVGGRTPSWSPDGQRLMVSGKTELRIVAADGSGENEVVINLSPTVRTQTYKDGFLEGASWSPDGSRIAFSAWIDSDFQRAFVINIDGKGGRTFVNPFNHAIWDECSPAWSPDGKRIALLGGIFGSQVPMKAYFGVGIVDPDVGDVVTINAPGTTCWDSTYDGTTTSGVAWSPDAKALAITQRSPGWSQENWRPTNQQVSIAIVDIATNSVLKVIPDAYDPTWSR